MKKILVITLLCFVICVSVIGYHTYRASKAISHGTEAIFKSLIPELDKIPELDRIVDEVVEVNRDSITIEKDTIAPQ